MKAGFDRNETGNSYLSARRIGEQLQLDLQPMAVYPFNCACFSKYCPSLQRMRLSPETAFILEASFSVSAIEAEPWHIHGIRGFTPNSCNPDLSLTEPVNVLSPCMKLN